MGPETGTIKAMTGLNSGEISLTGAIKATIHRDPFFSKSGASAEKPPPKEYDFTSITKIIARTAGTAFHAASRLLAAKYLTTSEKPTFSQRLFPDITAFEDYAAAITRPDSWEKRHGPIVTECYEWLWSLGSHNQPKIELKENQNKLLDYLTDSWQTITRIQSVMLIGLLELHPLFNRPNVLVLPEVRFQPRNNGLSRLGKVLAAPTAEPLTKSALIKTDKESVPINLLQALKFTDEETMHDWLHQVLVKQQVVFTNFKPLFDKLAILKLIPETLNDEIDPLYPKLLKLFTASYEKDFIKHFAGALNRDELTTFEMETLLALRIVCRAQKDMTGLLGGKGKVDRKDLIEVLKIFPLADFRLETAEDLEFNQTRIETLFNQLTQESQEIFAPIFIATDLLVLEMPENLIGKEKSQNAFKKLQEFAKRKYLDGKSPCLFQDSEFFALLTEACSQRLIIKIGDLKFSNHAIEDEVQDKHRREFRFYNLVLFTALSHYLQKTHPHKKIDLFDILRHPIAKALKDEFLIYCGINYPEDKRKRPLPQILVKTAITNPLQDIKEHAKLMHKIIKAMLVHRTAHATQQLGAVAEIEME